MLLRRCLRRSIPRTTPRRYATSHPSVSTARSETFKFAWLRSRSLIRLTGPDVLPFLQGLLTANITRFELPSAAFRPIYTAFLNAQGRILYDVFLWRGHEPNESGNAPWLIDVDAASRGGLVAHLKKHKLRSKIKLENVSDEELRVHQGWIEASDNALEAEEERLGAEDEGSHEPGSAPEISSPHLAWPVDRDVPMTDPRPGMGMRWLGTAEGTNIDPIRRVPGYDESTWPSLGLVGEDAYTVHRTLRGIAEGQNEIISGSALPQESNMDFFGGIDFRKGCYLGQELTIRTHHTGVVRKRILPVLLYKKSDPTAMGSTESNYAAYLGLPHSRENVDLPPPGSNISKVSSRGRSTGKWLGGIGNIGLALCRLEMMTDIRLTEEPTQFDPGQEFKISWDAQPGHQAGEVKVRPFVPQWLRNSITASLKSRERISTKDEEQADVD